MERTMEHEMEDMEPNPPNFDLPWGGVEKKGKSEKSKAEFTPDGNPSNAPWSG